MHLYTLLDAQPAENGCPDVCASVVDGMADYYSALSWAGYSWLTVVLIVVIVEALKALTSVPGWQLLFQVDFFVASLLCNACVIPSVYE